MLSVSHVVLWLELPAKGLWGLWTHIVRTQVIGKKCHLDVDWLTCLRWTGFPIQWWTALFLCGRWSIICARLDLAGQYGERVLLLDCRRVSTDWWNGNSLVHCGRLNNVQAQLLHPEEKGNGTANIRVLISRNDSSHYLLSPSPQSQACDSNQRRIWSDFKPIYLYIYHSVYICVPQNQRHKYSETMLQTM